MSASAPTLPTKAEIEAAFAADPVLARIEHDRVTYDRKERERIASRKVEIAGKEAELVDLKKARRKLSGQIVNLQTSIKWGKIRARYQQRVPLRLLRQRLARQQRIKLHMTRRLQRELATQMSRQWYQDILASESQPTT